MSKQRRRYTSEQKAEAVRLVREAGHPPALVAQQLGIPLSNVSRWVIDTMRADRPGAHDRRGGLLRRH